MFFSLQLVVLFAAFAILRVQSQGASSQTFWPAAVPLAVRSPYFNTWLFTTNGTKSTSVWPSFWNNLAPLGWAGHIRIDNTTYRWLGQDPGPNITNVTNTQITPTQTILTIQAGPMDLIITFLSPIEPADWVRQSIPFSYLSLQATSNDGQAHGVQVYSDISAEWLAGNRSQLVNWTTVTTQSSVYHEAQLQSPSAMTEIEEQADDGTLYYAMASSSDVTYQTGQDQQCRGQFASQGSLTDGQDTSFRAINNLFPVFAISVDLGQIKQTQSPIVWSVGYIRDPAISYTNSSGQTQLRSPLYASQYSSVSDVVDAFLSDFSDAMTRSMALDKKILQDATSISAEYSDLVSLAARQTVGGIDITISNGSDGQWNTSDMKIFMKDLGSSGRVSPVEVLYAAFPMFIYLNASFGEPLLSPLLEFQNSPQYTLPYAARDLGTAYPVASGDTASHQQGVEQSGNMLIMALAHARTSGDGSLLHTHYDLLKGWAGYLVNNSYAPINQMSADMQNIANMTNLAIKGMIGIQAMSEISKAMGEGEDAQQFALHASSEVSTWESLALTPNPEHLLSSYGQTGSWALMYNLYADLLLGTNLVSQSLYQAQADYYQTLFGSADRFGLPIDSAGQPSGNSAWLSFTAASALNSTVRDELLSMVWSHASYNVTTDVFPTMYAVDTGAETGGQANPGQGAMFAPLALNVANTTIVAPQTVSAATKKTNHAGAIAGGVIGGLVGLGVVAFAAIFFYRRCSREPPEVPEKNFDVNAGHESQILPYEITPFVSEPAPAPSPDADQTASQTNTMSAKMREYFESQAVIPPTGETSTPASSPYTISSVAVSSNPPSSSRSGSVPLVSPTELRGLRTEVENLRRVMQEIQADRIEAPPSYAPE